MIAVIFERVPRQRMTALDPGAGMRPVSAAIPLVGVERVRGLTLPGRLRSRSAWQDAAPGYSRALDDVA